MQRPDTVYYTERGTCDHCGRVKLVEIEYQKQWGKDGDTTELIPVRALCHDCQQH